MTSDSQFSAPARPRRRPGENRERLIEAGLIEFGLFGYHGASTAGIAARAEVPQPHVYASFPSKGELFLAVVRRVAERLAGPTALAPAGTGEGLLGGAPDEVPAGGAPAGAHGSGLDADGEGGEGGEGSDARDSASDRADEREGDGAAAARVLLQAIALAADTQLGPELHLELSTLRTRIGASAFDELVLHGAQLLLTGPEA
ncbi:TetR/AcrR family transcriptional regulator [Leucobacter iarius]|uniref:HTH tetR-type domain-containing protein n=1 Tax=Leucobacter iarius TaxID=333963 RepID=A0ABP4XRM1_9MICO